MPWGPFGVLVAGFHFASGLFRPVPGVWYRPFPCRLVPFEFWGGPF
jgi:hypothetical protein